VIPQSALCFAVVQITTNDLDFLLRARDSLLEPTPEIRVCHERNPPPAARSSPSDGATPID